MTYKGKFMPRVPHTLFTSKIAELYFAQGENTHTHAQGTSKKEKVVLRNSDTV